MPRIGFTANLDEQDKSAGTEGAASTPAQLDPPPRNATATPADAATQAIVQEIEQKLVSSLAAVLEEFPDSHLDLIENLTLKLHTQELAFGLLVGQQARLQSRGEASVTLVQMPLGR